MLTWILAAGLALAQDNLGVPNTATDLEAEALHHSEQELRDQLVEASRDPEHLLRFVEDGEVVHELTVYGERKVEAARRAVEIQLQDDGYTKAKDKGDYVRLRHGSAWKGEVRLYDDGWIMIKRQPVQFGPNKRSKTWTCVFLLPCLRASGQTLGGRKWGTVKVRTLDGVHREVAALGDRIADRETGHTINELPEHLEAVWYDGKPLYEQYPAAESYEDRKWEILDYWDTRTNTVWGDRVRVAVEAFIRAEVQDSEHAFTREEIDDFNDRRQSHRYLDLWSDWEKVIVEVDGLE